MCGVASGQTPVTRSCGRGTKVVSSTDGLLMRSARNSRAYAAMNAILLRRKFRNVANDILDGLKTFTEARQVATAE